VGIRKTISAILILLSIALLVFIQPFVGWIGNLNAKVNFGSMQKTLQEAEAVYTRALEVFLQMKSPADLFVNLFVMALLPAIGEELFFRGALQKVLLRLSNKAWLSILVSSGIFALLHGTFFKIIPIFALGILLGTVYYFTRNLWYTITIHFLNNALAVLAVYYSSRSVTIQKFANDNFTVPFYIALFSLLAVISIMVYIKKKSDEVLPEVVTNEDNDYLAG
jgi:membrane protease YdiL (CAAX protease family)